MNNDECTGNTEQTIEDEALANSNNRAQNEIDTNIKNTLSKYTNKRKDTTVQFITPKSHCKLMFAPYSEQSKPDLFIDNLDKELAPFPNVTDGNTKLKSTIKEDKKIDAVSCPKSVDCIPSINDNVNNITSEHQIKNSEVFLQKTICVALPQHISKCIECHNIKLKKNVRNNDFDEVSCRFCGFRQLRFNKSGNLTVSGFPEPSIDLADYTIWLPTEHQINNFSNFDIYLRLKIVEDVSSLFCHIFDEEIKALNKVKSSAQENREIVWKKIMNGVREMCDVCQTSLFNYHYFCGTCGFLVCIDCFDLYDSTETLNKRFNKNKWSLCTNNDQHLPLKFNFTQIIAGNCLKKVAYDMHFICDMYHIHFDCTCMNVFNDPQNASNSTNKDDADQNTNKKRLNSDKQKKVEPDSMSNDSDSDDHTNVDSVPQELKCEWKAAHIWSCEGALLRLLDPYCKENFEIFKDIWDDGKPVIISKVGCNLTPNLWHPESFSRDFGDQKIDFINCVTGKVIHNQPMRIFWDGFEDVSKRMCNSKGEPMLLKLKDWPTSTDFADMLPSRFKNLSDCLPLKEYTHRDGILNLASHLPNCFVRPDLGPKMYTAYGLSGNKHEHVGTTNLHLDMTDAVNVIVYVAITKNFKEFDCDWHKNRVIDLIKEAGCDNLTMKRIYEDGETPGALWHIYHPSEADRIRDLLTKVAIEQKTPVEQFGDPIHDQTYYLNDNLRSRLLLEYGVKGCTFVQFNGDAVFIPAGAPHQVRNLHNCIKVAEDFVSPENIEHSYKMTKEFRYLSDDHNNHEDKLQVKNIVFHSIKDSISLLISKYLDIGTQMHCD